MRRNLPVYCETSLNPLGSFPLEPINTYTSVTPVLLGALALIYLIRRRESSRVAYTLAILTILTGLGSMAWHTFRTDLTLIVDALPGVAYVIIIVFFWFYYLGARYWGLVVLAGFVAVAVLIPSELGAIKPLIGVLVLVAIAIGLVVATWYRKRHAFKFALPMIGAGIVAVILRSLDLRVCDTIPFGTHFFWHIFLGLAAYAGVRMIVLLKSDPELTRPQTPSSASGSPTSQIPPR
ncbi:MAG: hypothetical protein HOM52_08890 [Rhodospirillaceae bacterium]|jgi:hypothetical protein|nr:hypothetical protein [Rhodospirillaceae bacterium]MBT5038614.1 hypothetical protein [Rhodospirillaceae bacterium]MBT5677321.1 hypothetical protein [Rhodospirillaceae bacterium]MBT5778643.1 hypothetical protein [Rhodospirillaceae bacterium]MBT7293727.1 hypothetical protein [Rhodospirillaceae bacterium]